MGWQTNFSLIMGVLLAQTFLKKMPVTWHKGEHSNFNTGNSWELHSSWFWSSWHIYSNQPPKCLERKYQRLRIKWIHANAGWQGREWCYRGSRVSRVDVDSTASVGYVSGCLFEKCSVNSDRMIAPEHRLHGEEMGQVPFWEMVFIKCPLKSKAKFPIDFYESWVSHCSHDWDTHYRKSSAVKRWRWGCGGDNKSISCD